MQNYFSAFLRRVSLKMTRFMLTKLLAAVWLCLIVNGISAATSISEAEYENQIRKQLRPNLLIDLKSPQGDFVGIYRESALAATQGGIIIAHDLDQNADSPQVISPLAKKLTEHGWSTLSLQMPVPILDDANNALTQLDRLFPGLSQQATARIKAGIEHFLSENIENISIVGFGLGAKYAVTMMATPDGENLGNLVAVNLDSRHPPELLQNLEKIEVPVLDVYGSKALKPVINSLKERATAFTNKAGNENYRQTEIPGADHRFTGLENALISVIRAWLGKHSTGITVIRR
jgi:dienelactone hydrolase